MAKILGTVGPPPRKKRNVLDHVFEAVRALPKGKWLVVKFDTPGEAALIRREVGTQQLMLRCIGSILTAYVADRRKVQEVAHLNAGGRPPSQFRIVGVVDAPPSNGHASEFYKAVAGGVAKLKTNEWLKIQFETLKECNQAMTYIWGHGKRRLGLECRSRPAELCVYVRKRRAVR